MTRASRMAATMLTLLAGLVLLLAAPAHAAGETVLGTLRVPGQGTVANVKIVVADSSGKEVGTATSNAGGQWSVPVPGAGSYKATIDTTSLPAGVQLSDPSRATVTVQVVDGAQAPANFFLAAGSGAPAPGAAPPSAPASSASAGASDTVTIPAGDTTGSNSTSTGGSSAPATRPAGNTRPASAIWQMLADGLQTGLILALASIGVSLIYGTTGLNNFAHGELVTFGALAAYVFNVAFHIPFVLAAVLAVVASGAFGYLNEVGLWGPLRRRGSGTLAMMIVSIGVGIVLRYVYQFFFGGQTENYPKYSTMAGVKIGPISLTPPDLWGMGLSVLALVAVGLGLMYTRFGRATRAVSDNPALAAASGINVEHITRLVWTVGAALAGLAGIFLGLSNGVKWSMGQDILLLIFAAVVLGGLGTAFGALVGSIVVGVFIELSALVIPSDIKYVSALGVMIIVLLVRPQGILGRKERIG